MTSFKTTATGAAVALVATMLTACGGDDKAASSCETVRYAALDDASHRAAYYAIEKGLVDSDVVEDVSIDYLEIPALIQVAGSGQYDVYPNSLPGLVGAREMGGIDQRVLGFLQAQTGGGVSTYVRADSPMQSGKDLSGKTLGTVGFGSTMLPVTQLVLAENYSLDSKLEGGDVSFIELDPPTLLQAVKKGDVDAAELFHEAGWRASQDPELRPLVSVNEEYHEITGAWPVGGVLVTEGDVLEAKPACIEAFRQLLVESSTYATENVAEFSDEIAEQTGVDSEYIEYWWDGQNYRFFAPATDEEWAGWADAWYEMAVDHGYVQSRPDLDDVLVGDLS